MGAVSSESLGHPADFFTTEIWTPAGLVTFYVLFAIQLKTRRVHISIPTPNPDRVFMKQVALDLAAFDDSFLRGYSHLIIDRDSKYTTEFREVLKETTWTSSRFRPNLRTAILTRSASCARSNRSTLRYSLSTS